MKTIYLSFTGVMFLAVLSFCFCSGKTANKDRKPISSNGFAIVELFTSEGCSSCPPADEVMIKLAREFPEHVYFLGYHVDYWDNTGWKDQFSNPDYTTRQNKYAETFKLNSVYTPQAIINGEKELVGSKENQLRTIIEKALIEDSCVAIELNARTSGEKISISYKIKNREGKSLNIALVQAKAGTDVKRGENKGHVLNHINIVRELRMLSAENSTSSSMDFKIPQGLSARDLKVIAFIQNRENMKIIGAKEVMIQ